MRFGQHTIEGTCIAAAGSNTQTTTSLTVRLGCRLFEEASPHAYLLAAVQRQLLCRWIWAEWGDRVPARGRPREWTPGCRGSVAIPAVIGWVSVPHV